MRLEIDILGRIDHPGVVRIYETFQDNDAFYIIIELVTQGELFTEIVKRGSFKEKDCAAIIR